MDIEQYKDKINSRAGQWGSGSLTASEAVAVLGMKRQLGSWSEVRNAVIRGELPELEDMKEADFLESAVAHGCSVGWRIYNENEGKYDNTVWSYSTKNRAFRFVSRVIRSAIKNPAISESGLQWAEGLFAEWRGAETKLPDEHGTVETVRPSVEGGEFPLVGIEKLECYWPCQLLRYLEAIRMRREDIIELAEGEEEKFNIPWITYEGAIKSAETISDITINVALKTVDILRERGIDADRIAKVLLKGYSPSGPLKEHGQYDKISRIWRTIIDELNTGLDEEKLRLIEMLKKGFQESVKPLGYYPVF